MGSSHHKKRRKKRSKWNQLFRKKTFNVAVMAQVCFVESALRHSTVSNVSQDQRVTICISEWWKNIISNQYNFELQVFNLKIVSCRSLIILRPFLRLLNFQLYQQLIQNFKCPCVVSITQYFNRRTRFILWQKNWSTLWLFFQLPQKLRIGYRLYWTQLDLIVSLVSSMLRLLGVRNIEHIDN